MMPSSNTDFKKLFSDLIKKQMVILGPDITFAKVRNVVGIKADINGDVQSINGDPHLILQELINQFVELSGQIVKKTMETMLSSAPQTASSVILDQTAKGIVPEAIEPEPLHTINVPAGESEPEKMVDTGHIVLASPDQKTDPLTHEVKMPGEPYKPDPPSFTHDEIENLNKALDDIDHKTTHDTHVSAQ